MIKTILRALALTFGIFLMSAFCASSLFLNTAVNGEIYYGIQLEENVEPCVDNETMHELDLILAAFLAGDADALDSTDLFNADEKAHMADVYNIFSTLRLVKNCAFAVSALLLGWVYYNRQKYGVRLMRVCILSGLTLLLLLLASVGVWACIDFDAAFTAMHRLLFSNELWLMDPRTDLMIRMLPARFFISIGKKLAFRSLLGAIAVPAILFIGTLDWSKLEKKTTENE